jgi:Tfp pilus assembly protein PilX
LSRGFALVISLSLMVLLTILAVGLLGLSTLSLATAARESDLAEARANARMSLALAIAQLQKQTGPDQRVTVTADQLGDGGGETTLAAADKRHWAGVYNAWDATTRVRPQPEFREWLVSGDSDKVSNIETAKGTSAADDELEHGG